MRHSSYFRRKAYNEQSLTDDGKNDLKTLEDAGIAEMKIVANNSIIKASGILTDAKTQELILTVKLIPFLL